MAEDLAGGNWDANGEDGLEITGFSSQRLDISSIIDGVGSTNDRSVHTYAVAEDITHGQIIGREDDEKRQLLIGEELCTLRKKIRNVHIQIRSSQSFLQSNTCAWKENCLNPTKNCARVLRSVVTRYGFQRETDEEGTGIRLVGEESTAVCTSHGYGTAAAYSETASNIQETMDSSTDLFMLIQLSMQSGPLSGSKPGYFKRCGYDVASVAWDFLRELPRSSEELLFTQAQADAVRKWTDNAKKATENRTSPSKSMANRQRRQQQRQLKKREDQAKKVARRRQREVRGIVRADLQDDGHVEAER